VKTTILNNEEFLNLPRMDSFMRLSFGLKINKIKYSLGPSSSGQYYSIKLSEPLMSLLKESGA
jgi:hypothetical protein